MPALFRYCSFRHLTSCGSSVTVTNLMGLEVLVTFSIIQYALSVVLD